MSDKMKMVYTITQRGEKSYWTKVGVAFVNRDGSLNIKLEALPVNGELQVREQEDRDERAPAGGGEFGGRGDFTPPAGGGGFPGRR